MVIVAAALLAIPLAGGDGGETTDTDPTTEPDTDPTDPTDPTTPETDVTTAPPVTDTVPETSTDFTLPTITDPTAPPTTTPETVLVTTTSTTTPGPGVPEFGEGTQLVGDDIEPGTYITPGTGDCYWERSKSFEHITDDIIVNSFGDKRPAVEIQPGDVMFSSSRCGKWTRV